MNVYGTEQIRNVVLLGHGGAGKTTVAEALALLTGVTKRMGKVPDGNTISDYDKEEIKRQFSISTTLIPLEYEGQERSVKSWEEDAILQDIPRSLRWSLTRTFWIRRDFLIL